MNWIDFIIGLTLVNAVPHFVLGIWGGRILSGLGYGNKANILYGTLNLVISVSLFVYSYGAEAIIENSMYLGGLFVAISYFLFGRILHAYFNKRNRA